MNASLKNTCLIATSLVSSELSSTPGDLHPCGAPILTLLKTLTSTPHVLQSSVSRCNDVLRLATNKLHAFPYREVPLCWLRLYTDVSILKGAYLIQKLFPVKDVEAVKRADEEVVRTLDMALIMAGAPGNGRREVIERMLSELEGYVIAFTEAAEGAEGEEGRRKRRRLDTSSLAPSHVAGFHASSTPSPLIARPIPRRPNPPSLGFFQQHLDTANTPLIIHNLLTDWPATTSHPWSSPTYLLSKTHFGTRLVPVELGKSYTVEGWSQKIMPFREFLTAHILSSPPCSDNPGYLAQHSLFSQIPSLRADILTPDYCYTTPPPSPNARRGGMSVQEPIVNAWFGPAGTVSPLHTDPYANMLCQVLGRKYVRLYAPAESARLFPRGLEGGGVDMSNTSGVDMDAEGGGVEEGMWREFCRADYVEGVLSGGECLFIPAGWWHYVRSLDTSFSVSFWWN